MATAADSQWQAILACEVDGIDHVGCASWAHDERWPLVDHPVIDLAGFVVGVVLQTYQLAPEAHRELLHGRFFEGPARGHVRVVVLAVHHNLYSYAGFFRQATMPW